MTLKYKRVRSGGTGTLTVTCAARQIDLEILTGSCQAYDCRAAARNCRCAHKIICSVAAVHGVQA